MWSFFPVAGSFAIWASCHRCGDVSGQLRAVPQPVDDVPDGSILGSQVRLQAFAGMQDGFGVEVSPDGAVFRRPSDDLLPDHDDEHQDELDQAGEEQQEQVRIPVESEDLASHHPGRLKDHGQVKGRHRADLAGNPGGQPSVEPDLLLGGGWRRLYPCSGPRCRNGIGQLRIRAGPQMGVLRDEVILDLLAIDQDRLRVVIGAAGATVRRLIGHWRPSRMTKISSSWTTLPRKSRNGYG